MTYGISSINYTLIMLVSETYSNMYESSINEEFYFILRDNNGTDLDVK